MEVRSYRISQQRETVDSEISLGDLQEQSNHGCFCGFAHATICVFKTIHKARHVSPEKETMLLCHLLHHRQVSFRKPAKKRKEQGERVNKP